MNSDSTYPGMPVTDGWRKDDYLRQMLHILQVSLERGHDPADALRKLADGCASHLDSTGAQIWQNRMRMIAGDMEDGKALSDSLGRHLKKHMPHYMLRALAVAEEQDCLLETISVLHNQFRPGKQFSLRTQQTMTVPLLELCVIVGVTLFVSVFILPKFVRLFEEMLPGFPLPLSTALFARTWGIAFHHLGTLLALIIFLFLLVGVLSSISTAWHDFLTRSALRIAALWPWFKRAFAASQLATSADVISAFMAAGMDISEAIDMAVSVTTDRRLRKKLTHAREAMQEGKNWADAWENALPEEAFGNWAIRNAASLDSPLEGLQIVSEFYARRGNRFLDMGLRRLELTCLLLNSILAVSVLLALYQPLVSIITIISGGN